MRNLFAGLVAASLVHGVGLAQNPQPRIQPAQPAVGGQPRQPVQPGRAQPGNAVQPGQAFQPRQAVPGGQAGQHGTADQQIAACVFGACHNEIEVAKLAESKAQSEDVRDFAQKMVQDHTPGCQEMQRLAGNLAAEHGQQPRGAAGGQLDWVSIHKEVGEQCLASVKKELSSKQGTDFDQCFMGQQIGAHLMVIDELKVLKNHASSDLKQKLEKEQQTAEQHLQLAKQIEQKLKDRPSERVSRKPDSK